VIFGEFSEEFIGFVSLIYCMNQFSKFREEYSFSSVKRLVESSFSNLDVDKNDLSEAEQGILSDLSWDDMDRRSEHNEWATFMYDDTTVKVYVYAGYNHSGSELQETTVRFVLRDSGVTNEFTVLPDGSIDLE